MKNENNAETVEGMAKANRAAEALREMGWNCVVEVCERGGAKSVSLSDLWIETSGGLDFGTDWDVFVPIGRCEDGQAWIDAIAEAARARTVEFRGMPRDDDEWDKAAITEYMLTEFQPTIDALADEFGASRRECVDPEATLAVATLTLSDLRRIARRVEADEEVEPSLGAAFAEQFATDFRKLYLLLSSPERGGGDEPTPRGDRLAAR